MVMEQKPPLPKPPPLDYQPGSETPLLRRRWGTLVLVLVVAYFLTSIATLPFLDALWIGELPPLALIQLPKTALAGWLRTDVVMPVIRALGLSRGSFSPDYIMARPYALAVAYLLVLGVICGVLRISGQLKRASRLWLLSALAAAATDFAFTLWFADGPGLTVY